MSIFHGFHPEDAGSVSGAPNLPEGFPDTFTSRYVDTGEVRLHAVIGGEAPPLLLVHGWPETWYAWRHLMPALARDFEVIAVDQRGMGLSDKPQGGYDTGTQARELIGLIDALGHQRFAVIGHDIAPDVQSVVIPDTSHFLAEESPEELRLAIVVLAPLLAVAALVTLAAAILAIPYLLVRSIRSIRSHRAAPAPESAAADTARPRAVAASRPLG